jgi:hypothetical protein
MEFAARFHPNASDEISILVLSAASLREETSEYLIFSNMQVYLPQSTIEVEEFVFLVYRLRVSQRFYQRVTRTVWTIQRKYFEDFVIYINVYVAAYFDCGLPRSGARRRALA